jgi:hypothetical protein
MHGGSLFPFQKLSTLQLNTTSHSPNTREASTLSDVPHKTPSGNLPTQTHTCNQEISKHGCAQPLRSSGTNSHSCNQEVSKHTCFSHNFQILTQYSNQKESVAKHTRMSTLGDFQTWTHYKSVEVRRQQSHDPRNISVSIVACVTMLQIVPPFELLHC